MVRDDSLYTNLRSKHLPGRQGNISYFEFGDPDGAPLLCLHGLSITGLYFEQYHDFFVNLGVRAIAPNMLGGRYTPDPEKTIDDLASEMLELLDILGIDKVDVVGFSWGTLPQLALLARAPHRVRKGGFLGAMTPMKFIDAGQASQLKKDVRQSLQMVRQMPLVHRGLMWLVCKLPVAALIRQFQDDQLSAEETAALAPGNPFHVHFARCMQECLSTGSQFFTQAWRMVLDEPRYALADLAAAAPQTELRLYVAGNDNVHLPSFSTKIAAAWTGADASAIAGVIAQARTKNSSANNYQPVYAQDRCVILEMKGAGRMACVLYFQQAVQDLLRQPAA